MTDRRGDGAAGFGHALEPVDDDVGNQFEIAGRVGDRLGAVIKHLDDGADSDREQERDNQDRHRPAQDRLGGQQAPVRGLGDRLSQSLDGIGTRRACSASARHQALRLEIPT